MCLRAALREEFKHRPCQHSQVLRELLGEIQPVVWLWICNRACGAISNWAKNHKLLGVVLAKITLSQFHEPPIDVPSCHLCIDKHSNVILFLVVLGLCVSVCVCLYASLRAHARVYEMSFG